MSRNYSKKPTKDSTEVAAKFISDLSADETAVRPDGLGSPQVAEAPKLPFGWRLFYALGLPAWVFLGFMLAQALVVAVFSVMQAFGVPLDVVNKTMFNSIVNIIVYSLFIWLVIGLPVLVKKRKTTRAEMGLQRPPSWFDFAITPVGAVAYFMLTMLVTTLSMLLLTFIDFSQPQNTGFSQVVSTPEFIVAFVSLVVVAPIAEEVMFRGYLFGKLKKYVPIWLAVLISAALFAVVHGQWNVALDTFALGVVLALLRVWSKTIWPSIMLHMLKNGIAFYFLFINPSFLSTLVG